MLAECHRNPGNRKNISINADSCFSDLLDSIEFYTMHHLSSKSHTKEYFIGFQPSYSIAVTKTKSFCKIQMETLS